MSQIIIESPERVAITRDVWATVNRLPQRALILEGDARHWVAHVVGEYGELAKWHAARAGGFGGSQIGALVRNFHGQRADHGASAHDIVAGALLRKVPDEPNGHMRRGIAMEASHRDWFMKKYQARRDAENFDLLSRSVGPRPWMRYSPDELAYMPDPRSTHDGDKPVQRWLGDYKSPSEVDLSDRVAFQYVAQLHMGRLICEHNGIELDGMLLSQFDWKNWQLKDDVIEHIPELDEQILLAGDHYWNNFVMRGELPPYVRRELIKPEDGVSESVADEGYRLARLKAMAKIFKDASDALQTRMAESFSKYRFGASALPVAGSLNVTAVQVIDEDRVLKEVPEEILREVPLQKPSSSRYDEDKLLARVRATLAPGEKMSQFYAPGRFSSAALYEALVQAGIDADSMFKEQLRFSVLPVVNAEANAFVRQQFGDLLHVETPESVESAAPLAQQDPPASAPDERAASPDDREGHQMPRHVPRFVFA